MTRYLTVLHQLIGTADVLACVLETIVAKTKEKTIYDCCSGSGGLIVDAVSLLRQKQEDDIQLFLSDKFPDKEVLGGLAQKHDFVSYISESQDILTTKSTDNGIYTLVAAFHHFKPTQAKKILQNLTANKRHICIFEISDNAFPIWLWWIAIFPACIMTFLLTPFVRPIRIEQLLCTYLIPILPLCIAWDGAVSNARTYTKQDLELLTKDLDTYNWEILELKNKTPSKMLCLVGSPKESYSSP